MPKTSKGFCDLLKMSKSFSSLTWSLQKISEVYPKLLATLIFHLQTSENLSEVDLSLTQLAKDF